MNYSCFGPLLTTGSRNSCPPERTTTTTAAATTMSSSAATLTPLTRNGLRANLAAPPIVNSKSSDALFGQRLEANDITYSRGRSRLGSFGNSVGKLEIIQDLDLYFIRQIAHSLKEYDLEQKIDLEIKMREGTTKLLAACKHPSQSLEAAKSLITSNERMSAYMAELQRRKVQERKSSLNNSTQVVKVEPSRAKVAVSDIRMPLIWKDTDHFKNKGDYRRFSVFCLLKIGTEIYDTLMVENVDRSLTDITFEDVVLFQQIPPEFEFRLEVYSHVLQNDLSIASTPRKIKKKISSSVSRTIGRKLAATLKDELNSIDIGPKFDLVAHATLRLSDAGDDIKTHDLVLENLENPHNQLPLFGHFCCRLAAQPDCVTSDRYAGYLSLVQQVGEISGCRRMWCTLRNSQLSFWTKADDSHTLPPVLTITLSKTTQIQTEVPMPNYRLCFLLTTTCADRKQEYYLRADCDVDYYHWIAHVRQHLDDFERWGQAALELMEIPSPSPLRAHSFLYQRQGSSLYDATPVRGIPESPSQSSILQENNRLSPPPSLRSRSSSTSSAASSVSSSTRQHFSFFRFRKSATKDSVFY